MDGTNEFLDKSYAYAVRLVRGKQQTESFTNNNDGTVTDNNTGLMWAKCSEGESGSSCTNGSIITMHWNEALIAAKMSRRAGYKDWRLPNKKELESIVAYNRIPAINTTYFPSGSNYDDHSFCT